MKWFNWLGLSLIVIGSLLLFLGCMKTGSASEGILKEGAYVTYYYDEVHDVGIWRSQNGYGESMFILPASVFKNKELKMK